MLTSYLAHVNSIKDSSMVSNTSYWGCATSFWTRIGKSTCQNLENPLSFWANRTGYNLTEEQTQSNSFWEDPMPQCRWRKYIVR